MTLQEISNGKETIRLVEKEGPLTGAEIICLVPYSFAMDGENGPWLFLS